MFLEMLEEKERLVFLDLAHLAMSCDGEISKEELDVLSTYSYECKVEDFKHSNKSLDQCLYDLSGSLRTHKKIILLELMGIWAADDEWRDEEIHMMDHIATKLDIPQSRVNRLKRWSNELRTMIADGYALIND